MAWLAGIAIVFILGLSLGLGLLLVVLVRREGPTESGLGWEDAERVARRDDDGATRDGDSGVRDGDGTEDEQRDDRRT